MENVQEIIKNYDEHTMWLTTEKNKAVYTVYSHPFLTMIRQRIEQDEIGFALSSEAAKNIDFPIEIKLIFNHKARRTHFQVFGNDGELISEADITEELDPLQDFSIANHINTDTELRKIITEAIARNNGDTLPFYDYEVDLETLVLLNRFPGFPHSFYDAIPFTKNSRNIDDSFIEIAEMIDNYYNIGTVYEKLGLPNKKQFKKAVMENPALLFYAKELNSIPFQNYDVLLKIIRSDEVFEFLSLLHYLPVGHLHYFIKQLIAANGETAAWKKMKANLFYLPRTASAYFILPEKQQRKLLKDNDLWHIHHCMLDPSFNLPVQSKAEDAPAEQIDEYLFVMLRNSLAYQKAARVLGNCLNEYRRENICVFGIMHKNQYVAAVSVYKNRIEEATLKRNKSIEDDADIFMAFTSWVEKNGLEYKRDRCYN